MKQFFLKFPCFLYGLMNVGNLISGSSAFSKPSLYIWKFSAHVLLKPSLEDFEHYLATMWKELNCAIVWMFYGVFLLWDCNETWPVLWPLLSFPNLLTYWVYNFNCILFTIWKSSAGIPSPPLALFVVMLPKTHLTSHSQMSGSKWVTIPLWLSGSLWPFFV